MKIVIGITQEPEKVEGLVSRYYGESQTLTEVGPFITQVEALNWLVYLKSIIGDIEEIIPEVQSPKEALWYGFTFERGARH